MVPAEFVHRAVPMPANAVPQLAYLLDQLFSRHRRQVFIHELLQSTG
jgi:hypothetical protein